jgi:hypothetical protein
LVPTKTINLPKWISMELQREEEEEEKRWWWQILWAIMYFCCVVIVGVVMIWGLFLELQFGVWGFGICWVGGLLACLFGSLVGFVCVSSVAWAFFVLLSVLLVKCCCVNFFVCWVFCVLLGFWVLWVLGFGVCLCLCLCVGGAGWVGGWGGNCV